MAQRNRWPMAVAREARAAPEFAAFMAFVGPLISCFDESNSAPTVVMTIAVYKPYCGGMPAICA